MFHDKINFFTRYKLQTNINIQYIEHNITINTRLYTDTTTPLRFIYLFYYFDNLDLSNSEHQDAVNSITFNILFFKYYSCTNYCIFQFIQEVGEDSKLARSFERIRSIVRKKRSKERSENEKNTQLEQIVLDQVVVRRRRRRDNVGDARKIDPETRYSIISTGIPHDHIYSHSYHEALKRPVSGSDFRHKFDQQEQQGEKAPNQQQSQNGDKNAGADVHSSQETIKQLEEPGILPEDEHTSEKQRLVQKLSFRLTSEYGTQQSESKGTIHFLIFKYLKYITFGS